MSLLSNISVKILVYRSTIGLNPLQIPHTSFRNDSNFSVLINKLQTTWGCMHDTYCFIYLLVFRLLKCCFWNVSLIVRVLLIFLQ
jgi:hypothetical protein